MRLAFFFAVLVSVLLASTASAADPMRLEISVVEEKAGSMAVTVTAFDATDKPLTDLTAANFKAAIDGTDLTLQSLDAPGGGGRVSTGIVLLVDVSGTMYGEPIAQVRAALQDFVKSLDPSDQVAILAFSTKVTELQNFTTSRTALSGAINQLVAFGDTNIYEAVMEATRKASDFQASSKLVVLLTDGGVATLNTQRRQESVDIARANGVRVVSVSFGTGTDRDYLASVAEATNGRVLDAPTPAAMRQAYIDLAASIRARYTLNLVVPPAVDRTVPGKLTVQLTARSEAAAAERALEPLAGAKVPGFAFALEGLEPNQKLQATQDLTPKLPAGISLARVEYLIDGKVVYSATAEPFGFSLDPAALGPGAHYITARAADARGAAGETEISFTIPPPASSSPVAKLLPVLALLLLVGLAGGGGYMFIKKRLQASDDAFPDNVGRLRPFAVKVTDEMAPPEEWPERRAPVPQPANQVLGRIVVMDEDSIREGDLSKIREFSIGTAPLTLGAGAGCDIQIEDEINIAMEEARLWVQKGRLVYHKLTTLSAMATEGVTSGWLLLANGEDMRLGKYRLLYQAEVPASSYDEDFDEAELPPENSHFRGWGA